MWPSMHAGMGLLVLRQQAVSDRVHPDSAAWGESPLALPAAASTSKATAAEVESFVCGPSDPQNAELPKETVLELERI